MARAGTGSDSNSPVLARMFLALAGVTYGLLVFGATVRVHGAGLSCPDWPLCLGRVVPVLDFQVFLEWGHRVLASIVSCGFLGLAGIVAFRPALRREVGGLVLLAAGALTCQVILGGLTVLQLLAFWSVTLHLLTGNLFCALLLFTGLRLRSAPARAPVPRLSRTLVVLLAAAVMVQMALGGLVSSNHAGLACTEWPTCNGGVWFPVLDGIIGLQLAHRAGAYTVLLAAAAFFFLTRGVPGLRRPATVVLVVVCAQAALGIANVLLALPVEIAIAHSALADLASLSTTWAVFTVFAHPVRRAEVVAGLLGAPEQA